VTPGDGVHILQLRNGSSENILTRENQLSGMPRSIPPSDDQGEVEKPVTLLGVFQTEFYSGV